MFISAVRLGISIYWSKGIDSLPHQPFEETALLVYPFWLNFPVLDVAIWFQTEKYGFLGLFVWFLFCFVLFVFLLNHYNLISPILVPVFTAFIAATLKPELFPILQ